jgi:hypothetical protein
MNSKCVLTTTVIFTIGFISCANAATLSFKQQQNCAMQFQAAEPKVAANGLLCSIWTDPDCRAMAIQKGLIPKACAAAPLQRFETR